MLNIVLQNVENILVNVQWVHIFTYGTTYLGSGRVTQLNTNFQQQSNDYLDKPGQIANLGHFIPVEFQFSHQMRLKPIFILQGSLDIRVVNSRILLLY